MLYCSWGMVYDGCNCYFWFWAIFCRPPLTALEMNFSKKMKNEKKKNTWRYHFTQVYQISWYAVLFLRYGAWQMKLFFILGYFLHFHPPNSLKNQNFKKIKKNTWRYHHFTHVSERWWLDDVWFLRYGTQQTDGWTDGWKKWHRGGCHT